MRKTKKEMEYEDAPSGYVTLYNYKEPFMKFEEGYGYQGVLLFDGKSDKVQCHFCGEWFHALGNHLHKEHNMKAYEYKEAVGLRQTTALISEKLRDKLIASGLKKRLKNLRINRSHSEESRKKISESLKKLPRETQNEKGTCPQQLIDRLILLSQKIGRCPTTNEVPFIDTLTKVYGNFTNACLIAGLNPLKPSQTLPRTPKYTQDQLVAIFRDFYEKNKRFPLWRDNIVGKKNDWSKFVRPNIKEIKKKVLTDLEKYQRTGVIIRYTKNELITMLKIFKDKNGRDASISDCKRGLLPHASRYYYHFGSFKKALNYA